jgi:hypothetical protein
MNRGEKPIVKIKTKFAFLPVKINGKHIWMKNYKIEYELKIVEKCESLPFGLPWNRGENGRFYFYKTESWVPVRFFV